MAQEVTLILNVEDGELDGLQNELNQTARSFEAVQGEAKKTSTSLNEVKDNGGAIALLDSVTGGLATRMRDAAEATKLFNFNLKATRTALIATGIGAFVVAVGTLAFYWEDIQEFVTGTNKALERQLEVIQKNVAELEHELGLLEKRAKLDSDRLSDTDFYIQQKGVILEQLIEEQRLELANQLVRLNNLKQLQQAGGNSLQQIENLAGEIFIRLGKVVEKFLEPLRSIGLLENTDDLGLGEAGAGVKSLTERMIVTGKLFLIL